MLLCRRLRRRARAGRRKRRGRGRGRAGMMSMSRSFWKMRMVMRVLMGLKLSWRLNQLRI